MHHICLPIGKIKTIYFLFAALMGICLLEIVNYIEHYGLSREKLVASDGSVEYERTQPRHSWNSNHPLGRMMLFELSRHSDHHYLAGKKYHILEHHEGTALIHACSHIRLITHYVDAPQLPTGYPGCMLMSLIPPFWFYVMNQRVESIDKIKLS